MNGEHCPDCGARGARCRCAPGAGFDPLRVRPYVSLPDPGEADDDAPVPPLPVVTAVPPLTASSPLSSPLSSPPSPPSPPPFLPSPEGETPAYGMPVASAEQPWPGDEKRARPAVRRLLPVLIGAASVVALGGTAVALWVLPSSKGNDTALMDTTASAPVTALAPASPSQSPATTGTASPSPSASSSPSPSASKSPSPSPSASRSSAPPSPSASPSTSRAPSPTPPAAAPTLRYGDTGAEVEKLQRLLAAKGLYTYKINGRFDWRVEEAVSTFQYQNGIDDEEWGVYGPITRKALEG